MGTIAEQFAQHWALKDKVRKERGEEMGTIAGQFAQYRALKDNVRKEKEKRWEP